MNVPITTWFTRPCAAPWAELGAPAVSPAPSEGKSWHSALAGRSDSRREEVSEPAVRQEELPAKDPEVLAKLVELHEPEVLVTSGTAPPAAAVKAGTVAAAAGTAGEAGTAAAAAGTTGAAGGEDRCCCRKQRERSSSSCPPSHSACTPC